MEKCTLQEKIRLGSILDKRCGGGQIMHVNLQGRFASEEQAWDLLNHIAQQGVLYFAYNLRISVCENEHAFIGEICPKCGGKKVDTYQRVVGYLVPSSNYSKERKEEFAKRYWYDLNE
jgi:ribonucleoside-triphosphate reductase